MIPNTFDEWKNCLVNECKIPLTKDFALRRLAIYQDEKSQETKKFVSLYGERHLRNIINWLSIASKQ